MQPDSVIIFDIWGRYAHFKKIYVTTSALSYGVPFKTSIYGFIGAIVGLDNTGNNYLKHFSEDNCRLAIQVINQVKTQRINTNFSERPGPIKGNRKPTMVEYVVNPYYRIFLWHKDDTLMQKLRTHLHSKTSVYTPVLGIAHCLANFKIIGDWEVQADSGNTLIHSVIPKSKLKGFDTAFWSENEIHIQEQDMYPLEMNTQREVTKRDSILYDLFGRPVKSEVYEFFQVKMGKEKVNIMLM